MDDHELRILLDIGRCERRYLGASFVNDCHRIILVSPVSRVSEIRTELFWFRRRQALPAIAVGHIIIATVMVANGIIGARLHVPFPVLNRTSFGFWFSYFSVISRVILSMFWFGVQTFTGSECVYQVRIN